MFKTFLLLLLIILLSFNISVGETVVLPYTETSNISIIMQDFNDNSYTVITETNNEIYDINIFYKFGSLNVDEYNYIHNTSFYNNYVNTILSENYSISDSFLSKKVHYTFNIYENEELISTSKEEYNVFTTAPYFATTQYTILDNKINVLNKATTFWDYQTIEYSLLLDSPISINNINFTADFYNTGRNIYIQYIKLGERPKTYYVDQLNPILRLPYTLVSGFDKNNYILNFLLITSYIIGVVFFWIKVLYQSLFTLLIIFLIGVIPFMSYVQSSGSQSFINQMAYNYNKFFLLGINFVKYIVHLILKLIELLPFT